MRLSVVLALALLAAGCGGGGTLTAESFEKEAESLQSFAAEGALLAADVTRGKSTAPFARVHAGELAAQAEKLGRKLAEAEAAPGVREQVARASRLAERVAAALQQLESEPGDSAGARAVQRELEEAAGAAEQMAGGS